MSNLLDSKLLDDEDLLENLVEDSPLLKTERIESNSLLRSEADGHTLMSPVKDESPLLPAARTYRQEAPKMVPFEGTSAQRATDSSDLKSGTDGGEERKSNDEDSAPLVI